MSRYCNFAITTFYFPSSNDCCRKTLCNLVLLYKNISMRSFSKNIDEKNTAAKQITWFYDLLKTSSFLVFSMTL